MRSIYISPHLDDAALSAGGWIYTQASRGARPLVITCFAGVPNYRHVSLFASEQHQRWQDADSPVERRRCEDATAMSRLGADYAHWDYLDCIYRRDTEGLPMYQSEEEIFGSVREEDRGLIQELMARFSSLHQQGIGPLYVPLGVGHHVDHQIVREAGLLLMAQGVLVEFYEDYPYAHDPFFLQQTLSEWSSPPAPYLQLLTAAAVDAKISSVCLYRSQVETLFGGLEAVSGQVLGYSKRVGGGSTYAERFWRGGSR